MLFVSAVQSFAAAHASRPATLKYLNHRYLFDSLPIRNSDGTTSVFLPTRHRNRIQALLLSHDQLKRIEDHMLEKEEATREEIEEAWNEARPVLVERKVEEGDLEERRYRDYDHWQEYVDEQREKNLVTIPKSDNRPRKIEPFVGKVVSWEQRESSIVCVRS